MAPPESLSSLLSTLSTPPPSLASSQLLNQRLSSLLQLQRALSDLTRQRDVLGGLLARHIHALEDALAASSAKGGRRGSTATGSKREPKQGDKEDTELAFTTAYERAIAQFEAASTSNSFAEPFSTSSSSSCFSHPSLPHHAPSTLLSSLERLVADPVALGAGIATLEGSALSSLLATPSSSGEAPLEVLVKLLLATQGAQGVLQLALGCWEMAIREVVGREESEASASVGVDEESTLRSSAGGEDVGLGLGEGVGLGLGLGGGGGAAPSSSGGRQPGAGGGGRGQREKELEDFLVGMLGVLEGMGIFLPSRSSSSLSTTSPSSPTFPSAASAPTPSPQGGSTGPLSLTKTHETILLSLLSSSRALRSPPSPNPQRQPASRSSPTPKSPHSNGSHWSTLARGATETISSLSAYPFAGLSTVSGMLPPLPSSPIASPFYSPNPSPSPSTPPLRTTQKAEEGDEKPPPLPPKPPSTNSSPSSLSNSRFSPSQFIPSPELPSKEKEKDPLAPLLRRAAADLLLAFTLAPSSSTAEGEGTPLVQALISHLLSTSFPSPTPPTPTPSSRTSSTANPSSSPSPSPSKISASRQARAAHRKVLLLALVRFWAFSWLGGKLGRLSSGGCGESPSILAGVRLAVSGGEGVGARPETRQRKQATFDEVWLPEEEATRLGRGIQRAIYKAVVEACGAEQGGKDGEREGEEGNGMGRAARGFVEAWSGSSRSRDGSEEKKEEARGGAAPSLTAFALRPDEYTTLLAAFGPLILPSRTPFPSSRSPSLASPSPAPHLNRQQNISSSSSFFSTSISSANSSSPTITMSFKRSTAFSSPSPLAPSQSPSGGGGDRASEAEGGEMSLGDSVEELLQRLSWVSRQGEQGKGEAVLFALLRSKGEVEIRDQLPGWEEVARDSSFGGEVSTPTQTTRPPPPPHPLLRTKSSPPPSTTTNGWISPPHSPRQEALRLAMDRPTYPSSSPSPASTIREDPFLSFGAGLGGGIAQSSNHSKEAEQDDQTPSEQEMDLLRRGLFSLARSRTIPLSLSANTILPLLSSASARAAAKQDYLSHILYDQTASVLRYFEERGMGVEGLVQRVVKPLKREKRRREEEERVLRGWMGELEQQRMVLIERAREERGILNDLQIRAWYSSIKSSTLGRQLRSRLAELHLPRTSLERSQAQSSLDAWRKELGIHSFTRPEEGDTTFDESLMLVETAVAISCQPEMVFKSRVWAREKEVLARMVAGSHAGREEQAQEETTRPSFAESLLASGSSILSAPLSLAGLPLPSSPSIPSSTTETRPSPELLTILPFGACTLSLLKPHESPTPSPSAIEDFLLRLQLKLAAYLWSDLTSTLISPRNHEGRLCGSDAWFEEFASPLSPLPRPEEKELRKGVKPVPKAYLPTTPKSPDYLTKILERFSQHPSPHAKMHALLELELVLSATMSAPLSAQGREGRPSTSSSSTTTLPSPESTKGYLSKLTSLLPNRDRATTRMSLSPRPITAVLEDEPPSSFTADLFGATTSNGGEDKIPSLSDHPHRRSRSSSRPLSLTSSSSDIPSLPPTLLDFSSPSTGTSPLSSTIPLPPAPLTTDALLLTLESLLLHALPSLPALFQSLQIIASLTPSAILDHHALGKVFWDTAGAALSLKREVVEGEFGVVERGMRALSEGTEEGRELAERLVKIAAREESEVALSMLGSMGLPH